MLYRCNHPLRRAEATHDACRPGQEPIHIEVSRPTLHYQAISYGQYSISHELRTPLHGVSYNFTFCATLVEV